MKHPDHLAFTLLLSLCTLGFLPAAAQDPDGKPSNPQDTTELRLNTDAVKLIQFDFTPDLSKMNQPKEAPSTRNGWNSKPTSPCREASSTPPE